MGSGVAVEAGYALEDLAGALQSEHRVGQAVELLGELVVGQRVLVVAGRECDQVDELACRRRG